MQQNAGSPRGNCFYTSGGYGLTAEASAPRPCRTLIEVRNAEDAIRRTVRNAADPKILPFPIRRAVYG